MTLYLKDLYFGCADGDTEANEEYFLDLFYKGNNKYDEIVNNPMKFMIYGQKGTGKTILGRYIEKTFNSKGVYCKILNKDDITLSKMIEKNNELLSENETIQLFKWIIYREIYKIINKIKLKYRFKVNLESYKENKKIRKYNKAVKKLNDIFIRRYPEGNYEFLGYESSSEREIEADLECAADKLPGSKVKSRKRYSENKKYIKKEFYKLIEEVEENILFCLHSVNVTIILDDLDELDINFETSNNPMLILNKLIEAFKNINVKFANEKLKNSKCILLIRSDIIEELNKRSSNLNKIVRDNSVELYWIEKENTCPENHMLMKMILSKIKRTCGEYTDLSDASLYKKLFPESINDTPIINYMINNSFGRPRDIICFLELIKQRYPYETSFKATMFKECKQAYSDAFLKELYNEMKIHLPIDAVEDYLNIIRAFGRNTFYATELKDYYKPRRKNYANIANVNNCLEELYKFGVIGNVWIKGCNQSNKEKVYSWGYRKDGNPKAILERKFTVHYGLRNILNTNYTSKKLVKKY